MSTTATVVERDRLQSWIEDALLAAAVSAEQSHSVASALAEADARGIHTHGCEMLPRYIGGFDQGYLNPTPQVTEVSGRKAMSQWDGDNGLGHYTCDVVTEALITRAKEYGIAAASIGNSNHFGMASRYGMQLAQESLIGFVTTNTPPVMPALGGRAVVLGNNPLAWVMPRQDSDPITLDMAVSAVARGKIRLAAASGDPIPLGWASDAEGRDTTDASKALEGNLLPMGGPKGYGLAVINEVLSAALPAARVLSEISTRTIVTGDLHDEWGVGHFIMAIDPSATGPIERYFERVERIASVLLGEPDGGDGSVMLPGDPESRRERDAEVAGIPLPAASVAAVNGLSDSLGILAPW